jgi:hypothetical protein
MWTKTVESLVNKMKKINVLTLLVAVMLLACVSSCKKYAKVEVVYKVDGVTYQTLECKKNAKDLEYKEPGVLFSGWYTSKDYSELYDFSTIIEDKTILYGRTLDYVTVFSTYVKMYQNGNFDFSKIDATMSQTKSLKAITMRTGVKLTYVESFEVDSVSYGITFTYSPESKEGTSKLQNMSNDEAITIDFTLEINAESPLYYQNFNVTTTTGTQSLKTLAITKSHECTTICNEQMLKVLTIIQNTKGMAPTIF